MLWVSKRDWKKVQHKLSILRPTDTSTKAFRELVDEIAMLMGYEVLRELPLEDVEIETPITKTVQKQIAGEEIGYCPNSSCRD